MWVQTFWQARRNNEFHFLLCCFAWLSRPTAADAAAPTPYLIKKNYLSVVGKRGCGEREEGGLHALCISISVKAKFVWFFVVYDSCTFYCLLSTVDGLSKLVWHPFCHVFCHVLRGNNKKSEISKSSAHAEQRVFFSPCPQQASPPSSAPVANNNTFQQIPANTCIECYALPSFCTYRNFICLSNSTSAPAHYYLLSVRVYLHSFLTRISLYWR